MYISILYCHTFTVTFTVTYHVSDIQKYWKAQSVQNRRYTSIHPSIHNNHPSILITLICRRVNCSNCSQLLPKRCFCQFWFIKVLFMRNNGPTLGQPLHIRWPNVGISGWSNIMYYRVAQRWLMPYHVGAPTGQNDIGPLNLFYCELYGSSYARSRFVETDILIGYTDWKSV